MQVAQVVQLSNAALKRRKQWILASLLVVSTREYANTLRKR